MPDAVTPRDLIVSGRKVHAWMGGAGPTLLLLHAAWGNAEMSWSAVWEELATGFAVVAPDMPGFAASEPAERPGVSGSARQIRDLLDFLKTDRFAVVGNSFGAAVAIEIASLFPDRVSHLVVVNGTNLPAVPGLLKSIVRIPFIKGRFSRLIQNMSWSEEAFARGFPNPAAVPRGFIDAVRSFRDSHGMIGFQAVMDQAGRQSRPLVPTTVIWGTGDRLVSPPQMRSFLTWLGTYQYVPLEGAGHMPQVERPREFSAALRTAVSPR